jgi:O-antigen ligase
MNDSFAPPHQKIRIHVFVLLAYIILMPIGTGLTIGDYSIMNLVAICYFIFSVFSRKKWRISADVGSLSVVLYFVFSLFSLNWAGVFLNVNWYVYTFAMNMILFIFITWDTYNQKEIKAIHTSVFLSIIVVCAVTLINIQSAVQFRLQIELNRPIDMNDFGCGLLLIIALLIYRFYTGKKLLNIILLSVMLLILVLTGSRGALISGIAVICCGVILHGQKVKNIIWSLIGIAAVIIFFILIKDYIPVYLQKRFLLSTLLEDHGTGRAFIWYSAFETVKNANAFQMAFGSAFNTFGNAISPIYGYYKMSHNVFVQSLIETGFLGLSIFIAALLSCIKRSFSSEIKFILPALVGLIISSLSLDMHVTRIFGLILSLCFIKKYREVPQTALMPADQALSRIRS